MARVSYVNGRYAPSSRSFVHVEDRGYQFADGVYEVFAVVGGAIVDEDRHFARLERSLGELRIAWPMSLRSLRAVLRRMIAVNGLTRFGSLYLQITRGVAPRNHAFPPQRVESALVVTARTLAPIDADAHLGRGVGVVTLPDERWLRCDIKSVSLLPNVLAKQSAVERGAFEAWLIDRDGFVTEGSASNAWIVSAAGVVVTRPAGPEILNGVTRLGVLDVAAERGIVVEERPFRPEEALAAREAFLTSTTSFVKPVIAIDGRTVGDGAAGPITAALLRGYLARIGVGAAWR